MVVGVYICDQFGSERAAEDVARLALGCFLRGDEAQAHLLAGDGVVARDLGCLSIPDQIAARIAHMRNRNAVVPQSASHDGGRHPGRSPPARYGGLKHASVGLLDQTLQHRGVRLPILGVVESADHAFDRGSRRHFPFFLAANSVRQHKHPPVRAHLRWSRRRRVAHVVFVVVADSPDVGAFHEFEVKHIAGGGSSRGGSPGGSVLGSASRGFSKNFTLV